MADILEVRVIDGKPYIIRPVVFPSAGEDEEEDSAIHNGAQFIGDQFHEDTTGNLDGPYYEDDDGPSCRGPSTEKLPAAREEKPRENHRGLPTDTSEFQLNLPEVKELGGGRWECRYPVPQAFWRFIIGRGGDAKRKLEHDSMTKINVPRQGQSGDIVIIGQSKKNVDSGRRLIEKTIRSARQRSEYTHFLSIPMTGEAIRDSYGSFRKQVVDECGHARGFDNSIFQAIPRLHLTLGMLVLLSDSERKEATSILEEFGQKEVKRILGSEKLCLELKGLEYMNDDPGEVDVLYAKVHCDKMEMFREITDAVVERMRTSGYLTSTQALKLHVTLMNTRYRTRDIGSAEVEDMRPAPRRNRETFDAGRILNLFGDYNFGTVELSTVDICQLYASSTNRAENSEYLVIGSAKF